MLTDDAYRQILDEAAAGTLPDERRFRFGAGNIDHSALREARQTVDIAKHSGPAMAKRFRDHLLKVREGVTAAGASTMEDLDDSWTVKGRRQQADSHPANKVLKGVQKGRPVPTPEQLRAAGFPDKIAQATIKTAELIVAARDGSGSHVARDIVRDAGARLVATHPWPDPVDDWADLSDDVPPATTNDRAVEHDYDAIAQQVMDDSMWAT